MAWEAIRCLVVLAVVAAFTSDIGWMRTLLVS